MQNYRILLTKYSKKIDYRRFLSVKFGTLDVAPHPKVFILSDESTYVIVYWPSNS
jgi:hypothetical protein